MFWTMVFQFTFSGNVLSKKYDFQKTPEKSHRSLLKSVQILSYQKKVDAHLSPSVSSLCISWGLALTEVSALFAWFSPK